MPTFVYNGEAVIHCDERTKFSCEDWGGYFVLGFKYALMEWPMVGQVPIGTEGFSYYAMSRLEVK